MAKVAIRSRWTRGVAWSGLLEVPPLRRGGLAWTTAVVPDTCRVAGPHAWRLAWTREDSKSSRTHAAQCLPPCPLSVACPSAHAVTSSPTLWGAVFRSASESSSRSSASTWISSTGSPRFGPGLRGISILTVRSMSAWTSSASRRVRPARRRASGSVARAPSCSSAPRHVARGGGRADARCPVRAVRPQRVALGAYSPPLGGFFSDFMCHVCESQRVAQVALRKCWTRLPRWSGLLEDPPVRLRGLAWSSAALPDTCGVVDPHAWRLAWTREDSTSSSASKGVWLRAVP